MIKQERVFLKKRETKSEFNVNVEAKNIFGFKPTALWKKLNAVLKSSKTIIDAHFEISTTGETAVDMISLFPQKTFKNRKNG